MPAAQQTKPELDLEVGTEGTLVAAPMTLDSQVQALMARALEAGDEGVQALERLVDLQERLLKRQAEQEFYGAMVAFQADCPVIARNSTAEVRKDGNLQYAYDFANLNHIANVIRPHRVKHGLSYTFDMKFDGGLVTATCIVRHVGGHEQRSSFTAPMDEKAHMNQTQKVGSARSYAKRYALIDALGLNIGEPDDDGAAGGLKLLDDEQIANLEALLDEIPGDKAKVRAKFLAYAGVDSIDQIQALAYDSAVQALEAKRANPSQSVGK